MSAVAGTVIDRATLAAPLADLDQHALARLANPARVAVTTTTDRTKFCPECKRRLTVGTDGVEYGHARARTRTGGRCPNRPEECDPKRECGRA